MPGGEAAALGRDTQEAARTTKRRICLSADTTFFVRPDGSDSNLGDADTSGRAFATPQAALDYIKSTIDLAGFRAKVKLAAGLYQRTDRLPVVLVSGAWTGANAQSVDAKYTDMTYVPVYLEGDLVTPSNVVLASLGTTVEVVIGGQLGIQGVRVISGGVGIDCGQGFLLFGDLEIGATGGPKISNHHSGVVEQVGDIGIFGDSPRVFSADFGSQILLRNTTTILGNFSVTEFAYSGRSSEISALGATIVQGAFVVAGRRFTVELNGSIYVSTGSTTFFPGTLGGTVEPGSSHSHIGGAAHKVAVINLNGADFSTATPALPGDIQPVGRFRGADAGGTVAHAVEGSGSTTVPAFTAFRSRGTQDAPASVQAGDYLGIFSAYGYGTTTYVANGAIAFKATQPFTDEAQGVQLDFFVVPNDATQRTLAWTIQENGAFSSGSALDGGGEAAKEGLVIRNTAQAIDGVQQWSPRIRLSAQGWKTNAPASSQQVDYAIEVRTMQASEAPASLLAITGQTDGGGFVDLARILNSGTFDVCGGYSVNGEASAGQYLRGDGKRFIGANVVSGDIVCDFQGEEAPPGRIGEYLSSTLSVEDSARLTSGRVSTVVSLSLPPGDWDVNGSVVAGIASDTTVTSWYVAIGDAPNSMPSVLENGGGLQGWVGCAVGMAPAQSTGPKRVSTAVPATVFLVVLATFQGSSASAYGFIGARRAR